MTNYQPWWINIERQNNPDIILGPFADQVSADTWLDESQQVQGLCEEDCLEASSSTLKTPLYSGEQYAEYDVTWEESLPGPYATSYRPSAEEIGAVLRPAILALVGQFEEHQLHLTTNPFNAEALDPNGVLLLNIKTPGNTDTCLLSWRADLGMLWMLYKPYRDTPPIIWEHIQTLLRLVQRIQRNYGTSDSLRIESPQVSPNIKLDLQ